MCSRNAVEMCDDGEHVKLGMFCLPVIVSSSG